MTKEQKPLNEMTDAELVELGARIDAQIKQEKLKLEDVKELLRERGQKQYVGKYYMATISDASGQWLVDKDKLYDAFGKKTKQPKDEWFVKFSNWSPRSGSVSFKPAAKAKAA